MSSASSQDDTQPTLLVTGVAGVIGIPVACRLRDLGWAVRGVTRSAGERGNYDALREELDGVDLIIGDLRDSDLVARACRGVSHILHLAGSSGVAASFEDPLTNLHDNATPMMNLLHAASPGTQVITVSSHLVYGNDGRESCTEGTSPRPASPYAAHRVLLEMYGEMFAAVRGLQTDSLRIGNVFGEQYCLGRRRFHGVVPRLLSDLVNGGRLTLYGGGVQTVTLLHTVDAASAILAVLRQDRRPGTARIFNIGGCRISVAAIARRLIEGLGYGEVEDAPWPSRTSLAMARDIAVDDGRFRREYGWAPSTDVHAKLVSLGRWASERYPGSSDVFAGA